MLSEKQWRWLQGGLPLCVCIAGAIYFYLCAVTMVRYNLILPISDITTFNLSGRILFDFMTIMFPAGIIPFWNSNLRLRLPAKDRVVFFLFGVYLLLFFLHFDFSVVGVYRFFFYLVIVAFNEELVFRAFLYQSLSPCSELFAVIASGALWGAMHAILPWVIAEEVPYLLFVRMFSEICGSILSGYLFIYLLKKSKTLWVPVLVHAIMDYSVGLTVLIFPCMVLYYYWVNKKQSALFTQKAPAQP